MVYFRHISRLISLLLFLPLVACGPKEPAAITLPSDVAKVSENFLLHVQAGDEAKAEASVLASARVELHKDFPRVHAKLKALPPLTPRFITKKPLHMIGPDDTEYTVIYAVKQKDTWTTAELRLYRLRDEAFEIDYWRISNDMPVAKNYAGPDAQVMRAMIPGMLWGMGSLAFFSVIGLAIFIWLVKRKPAMVAPEIPTEHRVAAVTIREEGVE